MRQASSSTLATRSQSGIKMDKKRIAIAFIVNATGTEAVNPIVIGHNKNNRCLRDWNTNKIVTYYFNSNAWMNMDIFSDWLLNLNNYLGKQDRNILLTLDNAGGHNVNVEVKNKLNNIVLEYFDPNVTTYIQPLDMGIIHSEKALFRKNLVRHCLEKIGETDEMVMATMKAKFFYFIALLNFKT